MQNVSWRTAATNNRPSTGITTYTPKKTFFFTATVVLLLIAGILLFHVFSGRESSKELYIDYTTNAYRDYSEFARRPGSFSKEILEQYEPYHLSAMSVMEQYGEEGLQPALLTLYERLAHSEDPGEILELHESLLSKAITSSCWLWNDPQFAIDIFQGKYDSAVTESERAAAEYLIALTYTIGNFSRAVLTDEEYAAYDGEKPVPEIEELVSSRSRAIKEKGSSDLMEFIQKYPISTTAFLARIDYASAKASMDERTPDIRIYEEGLKIAQEYYPDSAFMTFSYYILGMINRIEKDYKKAVELYTQALEYPDYSGLDGHSIHSVLEEEIATCTRDSATPPP